MRRYIRAIVTVCAVVAAMYMQPRAHVATDAQVYTVKRDIKVRQVKHHRKMKHKSRWIPFVATAYTPYEPGQGTLTKSGTRVQQGLTIATDPRVIPLGSWVRVKFDNGKIHLYRALDTGGMIIGKHIDLFMWSRRQALDFGVQHVYVQVIK